VCETYSNKNLDKPDVTINYTSHILPNITEVTFSCFRNISHTWLNFRKCDYSLCLQRICQYNEKFYCFLTVCQKR